MINKCAILLATYNGEKYIAEQIDSIQKQKNVEITIFVSDDLSKDSTLDIIEALKYKNIIILPKTGRMGSAAQNFFRLFRDVDFLNYDYIALSDQDDIWLTDKIINAISAIKEKNLSGYASNVTASWENGKTKLVDKSADEVKWDYLFGSAGPGCTIVLKSVVAQTFKELLIEKESLVNKIDLHHDWLIYAYIRSSGLRWWVDSESSMLYRQHENNELGANSGFQAFLSRWKKARGGWYGGEILRIATFCDNLDAEPIRYLKSYRYMDKLYLAKMAFNLRKRKSEAIMLALMLIVPGFKI